MPHDFCFPDADCETDVISFEEVVDEALETIIQRYSTPIVAVTSVDLVFEKRHNLCISHILRNSPSLQQNCITNGDVEVVLVSLV